MISKTSITRSNNSISQNNLYLLLQFFFFFELHLFRFNLLCTHLNREKAYDRVSFASNSRVRRHMVWLFYALAQSQILVWFKCSLGSFFIDSSYFHLKPTKSTTNLKVGSLVVWFCFIFLVFWNIVILLILIWRFSLSICIKSSKCKNVITVTGTKFC